MSIPRERDCNHSRIRFRHLLLTRLGVVYEKRLIEQYINEHGTEPNSGEALTAEDLLPINSSRIVRPRPPTLTSIPALLATFQNEWDNLALETYNLKEQLSRTREELATALYQHDAAVRVIARLTKERDEARESLSKVTVTGGASNGDEMMVDSAEGLPEDLAQRVDAIHAEYVILTCSFVNGKANSDLDYQRDARSELYLLAGLHLLRYRLSTPRRLLPPPLARRHLWITRAIMPPLVACRVMLPFTRWKLTRWRDSWPLESLSLALCGLAPRYFSALAKALSRCMRVEAKLLHLLSTLVPQHLLAHILAAT